MTTPNQPSPAAEGIRAPTAGRFLDQTGMLVVLAILFVGCALGVKNFSLGEPAGTRAGRVDDRHGSVHDAVLPGGG